MKRLKDDKKEEKYIRDDCRFLALNNTEQAKAWKAHCERLLNIEFEWNKESIIDHAAVQGPNMSITEKLVSYAIFEMKTGIASGEMVVKL